MTLRSACRTTTSDLLARVRDALANSRAVRRTWFWAAFIFVAAVLFRVLTAEYIEAGGDAVRKWWFCKLVVQGRWGLLEWNHHTMRWAINLPVIAIQWMLGAHPSVYYVWPILSFGVAAVFFLLIGNRLFSRPVAVLLTIAFIAYPQMVRQGAQFLPSGPGMMYLLIAVYCLLRWLERRALRWTALSAVAFFAMYGSKITAVYYLPVILGVLIWWSWDQETVLRKIRPALVFMACLVALVGVECVVFQQITGFHYGRLGRLLTSGQIKRAQDPTKRWGRSSASQTLGEYAMAFKLYGHVKPRLNVWCLHAGFLAAVGLLLARKRRFPLVALLMIIGYLAHVYAVVGVFPFRRPEPVIARVLTPLYALSIITVAGLLVALSERYRSRLDIVWRGAAGDRSFGLACLVPIAMALLFVGYSPPLKWDGLHRTRKNIERLLDARRTSTPVVAHLPNTTDARARKGHISRFLRQYKALYSEDLAFSRRLDDYTIRVDASGKSLIVLENEDRWTPDGKALEVCRWPAETFSPKFNRKRY
jgi:dolichyl-phosphate-mannose-protein mannosyltransferase